MFRDYLDESLATENLQFWEEVEVYRASNGGKEQAAKLMADYINSDGPFAINIDYPIQQETTAKALTGASDVFDLAQMEIFRLLADDRWEKFKQSPHYLRYTALTSSGINPVKIAINLLVLVAIVAALYYLTSD